MKPEEKSVSGTVLVIEDNPVNMKLTRGLLGLLGCRVLEAEEAETGLEILRTDEVDLVLLDIQLPGMDGMSTCRIIRQEMGRTDLPIIALSALAMEEDLKKASDSGFDDYVTKPMNTKKFLEMVSGWLSGESNKAASESFPAAAASPNLKKILVVDDSMTNVKLLKSMLPDDLYEVTEAYNGQQALDAVALSQPDVIFLDIMMPDIDGYEVTRRLKADPDTAHIPIVMVTALDGMEDRVQGFNLGAEDVLVKPVNRMEVISRARSMVRLSQYQKELSIREQAAGSFSTEPSEAGAISSRKRPSILLVEDNQQEVDLFQINFGKGDYDMEVAMDGGQALKYLEEKEFDLVLLDLLLPDMDGLEILDKIKAAEHSNSPQTVIVTALSDLDTRLKGIEHGADEYLVKPVHPRELQARIQVLLRKKGYMDSLRAGYQSVLSSAMKDDLTGVYNKAYLNRYLELEIKRSQRHKYPVSLVMVDIDDFKNYNTRFGHLVGDLVIREVASVLKDTFRDIDLVARFGGDEFVVVLPYCSEGEIGEIVKRVCNAVSTHPFPTEDDLVSGTVSISTGTATCPGGASTAEDLIKKADDMLLRGKQEKKTGAQHLKGEAAT
jgi:two-component system cell cycle response regulator